MQRTGSTVPALPAVVAMFVAMTLQEVSGFTTKALPRAAFAGGGSLAQQMPKHGLGPRMSTSTPDAEVLPALTETPPLKIGLMVEPTPFTHISGYSNRYKEMLTYLNKAGDTVEIIVTDDTENPPKEFQNFPIDYTHGFRFALYPIISMSIDWQMKGIALIKRLKPDIMHVTTPSFMVLVCGIYAKMFGIPLIMTYHTHLPVYARNYLGWVPFILPVTWFTVKYIHAQADLTLVTSPQLKAEFEEQGIERVDVWRKGIDTVSFNPKYKNAETRKMLTDDNPDDFLIVYIGRLGKEKRIEDLKGVLEKNPNIRLAIVGGGPYMENLKEAFKGTKTVFTGTLLGQPLWEAFASGDVFIMPSDSETLGFVVLESLASGVPVIGARAGGIPDLIDENEETRTGYLVPPGDIDAMSTCVNELINDREKMKAMGVRGRNEAERWSWEKATAVLRNVQYRKAIKRHEEVTAKKPALIKLIDLLSFAFVGYVPISCVYYMFTCMCVSCYVYLCGVGLSIDTHLHTHTHRIMSSTIVGVGSTIDGALKKLFAKIKALFQPKSPDPA
jgi:sulfoquinovosyltransferase